MKRIDTSGLSCPAPLIKMREGLNAAAPGEEVQIVIDNSTSLTNVKRYLTDNGLIFTVSEEEGKAVVTVSGGGRGLPAAEEVTVCPGTVEGRSERSEKGEKGERGEKRRMTVVAVGSELMGSGDEELGARLMVTFFRTLELITPQPAALVLYNSGVKLATDSSPVRQFIGGLEERGTAIYICSTCISHYGLREQITTGSFSDMFMIMTLLNDADHIIRP